MSDQTTTTQIESQGSRTDLLVEFDGVEFDEIEDTRQVFEIPIISPDLLLKNK